MILIKGGRVFVEGEFREEDILIERQKIKAIGKDIEAGKGAGANVTGRDKETGKGNTIDGRVRVIDARENWSHPVLSMSMSTCGSRVIPIRRPLPRGPGRLPGAALPQWQPCPIRIRLWTIPGYSGNYGKG